MSNTPGGARRAPPSRPTTPLRPLSGSSLRASSSHRTGGNGFRGGDIEADDLVTGVDRLETTLEPQFADLAEGMADLEANLIHLQLQHESLARFAESFASFLYGMEVNAFCVDFPEAPVLESFIRARSSEVETGKIIVNPSHDNDTDATFLTTDTSFVENPPISTKLPSRYTAPRQPPSRVMRHGQSTSRGRGRGVPIRSRPSGLARAASRGGMGRASARGGYR